MLLPSVIFYFYFFFRMSEFDWDENLQVCLVTAYLTVLFFKYYPFKFQFFFSKYNFLNNPIFKNLKYNLYYTNPICVQHFWLWVIQLLHKVIGIQFKAGLFLCQFFKFSHTIFLYVKLSPFVKRKGNAREIYVKPISI